jgi:capsular exopolysaccharide synthesis family protein
VDLRDYIRVVRKGWALIAVLALVGIGVAAIVSLVKTPEYTASSQVFVSTQSSDTVQDLAQGNTFTQARVQTYADLVATPIVLLPVAAKLHLDMTSAQLAEHVTASAPLNTTLIQIDAVSSDAKQAADIANATATSLTAQVQTLETPSGTDASPVKLTRVEDATVPTTPTSPNVPLFLAIGLLLGLVVGVTVAILRETLDTRIRNEHDIELLTEVPIVGGIAFDPRAKQRPLIVQSDPRSPRSESFRTLRTNLQFLDIGEERKSFVVTSSIESEGKSTTASNLAIALADAGARVLIVDADLRRPRVAEYMGLEGAVGLTDLLIGRAELLDAIQPWGKGNLFVLPAGKVPPNPSELLGAPAMIKLIRLFEQQFDYVLFDAPPLLPVTDAAILATHTGGAIVVVAAGRVNKNQLKGAITTLGNVGGHIAGLVLTMVPTRGPDAYGYGRYGYGYGYGYGYTEKPSRRKDRGPGRRQAREPAEKEPATKA